MNKKGQIDFPIITIIFLVFGLLLIAPMVLKIFNSVQSNMSPSLGNVTGGAGVVGQENFNTVMGTAINFWDKVIVAAFVLSIIIMLLSSFLIDTHPVWIILYIFISFMLFLFAPDIIGSLDTLYDSPAFATEVSQLSFMDWIRVNFGEFLVGLFVITGIIIYGKMGLFPSQRRRG